jgi:hypothetical protein
VKASPDPRVLEILREGIEGRKKQTKSDKVPTMRFNLPELTPELLVKSVQSGVAPWRLLSDVARESIEEQKAPQTSGAI